MQDTLETRIRERAYHLWVAAGCREGEADRHWLAAEREVLADFAHAAPAAVATAAKRAPRRQTGKEKALAAEAKAPAPKIARRRAS